VVEAYRTVIPEGAAAQAREIFGAARPPDLITFTSSSTVQNLVSVAGPLPAATRAVSIGPVTTQTARSLGIQVATQARVFTVDGLVEAILEM